jgi:GH24 family phage-related lysozyme (muramidase)
MPEIFTREQLPSAPVEEPTPIRISDQYPEATALIRKYESVNQSGQPHLNPYKDSGGNWTVGYGQLIDADSKDIERTPEWAESNLDNQIEIALEDIRKLEAKLPEGIRFTSREIEGLIPILQNVGYTKLTSQGKNAMKALRAGDKDKFAKELFDSEIGFVRGRDKKGKSIVLNGLVERRGREGEIFYSRDLRIGGMVQRNPYPYMARPI